MKQRLLVSVSGGETSWKMAIDLSRVYSDRYDMIFAYANTGLELLQTFEFNHRCSEHFRIPLVWVEAVVHPEGRLACTHKVVDFKSAYLWERDKDNPSKINPFEEVIKKYGIPNVSYLHCTRELKANPIRSYIQSEVGWEPGSYRIAIGIRGDEPGRIGSDPEKCYPLAIETTLFGADEFAELYATKPMINDFWEEQPFRLELMPHEGNCQTCFKKHTPKLVRIGKEHPERFDFTAIMEEKYGLAGYNEDGTHRKFYRGHMDTKAVLRLAGMSVLPPLPPDAMDIPGGCSESCEAF